ncbi:hypothetical protein NLJ89_g11775 [Agrocybe chaxingu]|uniref:Uncharacterized protein n=1 Tax=Agrocybe chaxingu TaxID=84603 RepID=A0A9W8JVP7_9AGAR|nr:hypothetical protein NLJ89_g11775 [Agrocybe chaxingu]
MGRQERPGIRALAQAATQDEEVEEVQANRENPERREDAIGMDVDDCGAVAGSSKDRWAGGATESEFGMEVTNTEGLSKSLSKRSFADTEERENGFATPQKRQKRTALGTTTPGVAACSEDEMELPTPARKSKRKAVV